MIAGLSSTLACTLSRGLQQQGVAADVVHRIAGLPPVATLFSAVLGENPIEHLLSSQGALASLSAGARHTLTGRQFFPGLIAGPFHAGLVVVFVTAAVLSLLGAGDSLLRGAPTRTAPTPTSTGAPS